MRILHTADWHLGKNIEGKSRLDEQEAFLNFFIEKSEELRPDLILIAGDIFDVMNPLPRAEQLLYDALKRLSRGGDCLTLLIAGNHDNPERLVAARPLAKDHGIIMIGTPKSIVDVGSYGRHEVLNSGEGFLELNIRGERLVIVALPYPSEKRLNELIYGENEGEEERLFSYQDKMKSIFSELEKHFREDSINITVSHLFALGSTPSGSERNMSLGGSFVLGTDILPKGAHYTALGHIHRPQILSNTGGLVRYSGSPLPYSLVETAYQKKFYVIDIDEKREVVISDVDIPVFKPIELWQVDSIEEAIERCEANRGREAWVYLEVKMDRPIREDEIKRMKSSVKDILEIRPIMQAGEKRVERKNVNELSFEEQFKEYYKAKKGLEPRQELVDLLMEIWEGEEDETN